MKVKDDFMQWMSFKIQNGEQTRLWEDNWLGNTSLKLQYLNLYNLAYHKHDIFHKVLNTTPLNVSFRRNLQGNNLKDWLQIVSKVVDVELVQGHDIGIWTLQQNGLFSVHSMYLALMDDKILPINRPLWKLKIPLKVKVFIWLLHRGVHWPREVHCQHGREEPEPETQVVTEDFFYLGLDKYFFSDHFCKPSCKEI